MPEEIFTALKQCRAISPTHITGFFEIKDSSPDPTRNGSRGAGVCLDLNVETIVSVTNDNPGKVHVTVNGEPAADAEVSRFTGLELLRLFSPKCELAIRHKVPVPIASGFGTSGAAALGIALAGSEALSLKLSPLEAAQLAHNVEVNLRTGLGTVDAEYYGGLEVRAREGAPGIGEIIQIPVGTDERVVACNIGPMLTKEALSNPAYRRKINALGGTYTDQLLRDRRLQTFLSLSQQFMELTELLSEVLRRMTLNLRERGYLAGMAMFGHTIFTVVKENEVHEVVGLMNSSRTANIIVSRISRTGARVM